MMGRSQQLAVPSWDGILKPGRVGTIWLLPVTSESASASLIMEDRSRLTSLDVPSRQKEHTRKLWLNGSTTAQTGVVSS